MTRFLVLFNLWKKPSESKALLNAVSLSAKDIEFLHGIPGNNVCSDCGAAGMLH